MIYIYDNRYVFRNIFCLFHLFNLFNSIIAKVIVFEDNICEWQKSTDIRELAHESDKTSTKSYFT